MGIIIKNQEQIKGIRRACDLVSAALLHAKSLVKPDVTTEEIDFLVDEFVKKRGGASACLGYRGYPKSTCISVNEVICHGVPNQTKLKEGDIVSIDIVAKLNNFYGDICGTFPVGQINENAQKLIDVTYECLVEGIKQIVPYRRIGVIGDRIKRIAHPKGYSIMENYAGHGVGLAIHEEPIVPHNANAGEGPRMIPGMVFTVEPMINEGIKEWFLDESDQWTVRTADGKLSAQFEHTVLVTKFGHEILTRY
jgi:methionyl aminopeptidase